MILGNHQTCIREFLDGIFVRYDPKKTKYFIQLIILPIGKNLYLLSFLDNKNIIQRVLKIICFAITIHQQSTSEKGKEGIRKQISNYVWRQLPLNLGDLKKNYWCVLSIRETFKLHFFPFQLILLHFLAFFRQIQFFCAIVTNLPQFQRCTFFFKSESYRLVRYLEVP